MEFKKNPLSQALMLVLSGVDFDPTPVYGVQAICEKTGALFRSPLWELVVSPKIIKVVKNYLGKLFVSQDTLTESSRWGHF